MKLKTESHLKEKKSIKSKIVKTNDENQLQVSTVLLQIDVILIIKFCKNLKN